MKRRIDAHDDGSIREGANARAKAGGVSRRRVLRGAAMASSAAVAGTVAATFTAPHPANATTGNTVLAGEQTNAEASTVLFADAPTPFAHGLLTVTDTPFSQFPPSVPQAAAVLGFTGAHNGYGVVGVGTDAGSVGVFGQGNAGVQGTTSDFANQGYLGWTGFGAGEGPYGVYGTGTIGVAGVGTNGGPGLYGRAIDGGAALQVDGPVEFARSGLATVAGTTAAPESTVTVSDFPLSKASLVLATIQGVVKGIAVQGVAVNAAASKFTIHLTKAVTTKVDVAWFVIG